MKLTLQSASDALTSMGGEGVTGDVEAGEEIEKSSLEAALGPDGALREDSWLVRLDFDAQSAAAVLVPKAEAVDVPVLKALLAQGWLDSFGPIGTPKHWAEAAAKGRYEREAGVRTLLRRLEDVDAEDGAVRTSPEGAYEEAALGGAGGEGRAYEEAALGGAGGEGLRRVAIRGMDIRFHDAESGARLMVHTRGDLAAAATSRILYVGRRSDLAPIRSDFSFSGAGGV